MSSSFTKSQYLVDFDDQRYFNVTSIIQFLNILLSHEKYQTQKSVVDQLFFRRHAIEKEFVSFLDYVVNNQIWFSKIILNQFIVEWQFFQKIARQKKKQQNHENKTNHRNAMKIFKRFFNDWSKLSFSQFFEKINRTILQKWRNKTNHQNRDTSCDAFNVKSKIHYSDHC
jgi:hypothetical protein